MERTISPEERIRRAEEIYYRRKKEPSSVRMSSSQVKDGREKRQFLLYKKMIIQVLVCILIYLVFSLIKDANYIFSEDVVNKTKEFLSTDINFEVIAGNVGQFFQDNKDKLDFIGSWLTNDDEQQNENKENNETNQTDGNAQNNEQANVENNENENTDNKESEKNNIVDNEVTNNVNSENSNNTTKNSQVNNTTNTSQNEEINNTTSEAKSNTSSAATNGIGGASNNENVVTTSSNSSSSKTQMEKDAEYIKKNFSLGLPVKGTITSRYGQREATEIVSANHFGIDIGVNEGTTIVAAMEGKVSLVSDEGEYGTHIKIVNKDVTTIYAHCSKILVKEGATIKKGQKIALSGNTGRTTGPHLHFEILRGGRTVDPELVLKWN